MILGMLAIAALTASSQTKKQLFDFGWQFTHNGKTIGVDLPHDWDIYEGPHSGKGATGTGGGWFEAGKGEYRKTFATPKGELVKFHFEGVYQKAEVFINGKKVGQHHYGYTPFTIDATTQLYNDKREMVRNNACTAYSRERCLCHHTRGDGKQGKSSGRGYSTKRER